MKFKIIFVAAVVISAAGCGAFPQSQTLATCDDMSAATDQVKAIGQSLQDNGFEAKLCGSDGKNYIWQNNTAIVTVGNDGIRLGVRKGGNIWTCSSGIFNVRVRDFAAAAFDTAALSEPELIKLGCSKAE